MPSAHPLTDHEEIRAWAEARGAKPARVKGTGRRGDPGMIRLDFPGFSGGETLEPITWDEWFEAFDKNNLALLVQDRTARGGLSNFNKLVAREPVAQQQRSRRAGAQGSPRGGRKTARTSGRGARKAGTGRKTSARESRSAKAKTGARKSTKQAASGRTRSRAASRARSSGTTGAARTGAAKRRSRRT